MTDTPHARDRAAQRANGARRQDAVSSTVNGEGDEARARIVIPEKHPMVTVLGSGDSLLRVIEKAFPGTDIHVRGNEVTAIGDAAEIALVQHLFDEMMLVLRTGQPLTEDAVERSIAYAYLPPDRGIGTRGEVEVFGAWVPFEVVKEPIYDPADERIRG